MILNYSNFLNEHKAVSEDSFFDILDKNKEIIYAGIISIGHKLFSKSHSGFVHSPIDDTEFSTLNMSDFEDYEEDESIVDDAYYLGVVFDKKSKKVTLLPGYEKLEGDQITVSFVNNWYKKAVNKDKYLISYDASIDDVAILVPSNIETGVKVFKEEKEFPAATKIYNTLKVGSILKGSETFYKVTKMDDRNITFIKTDKDGAAKKPMEKITFTKGETIHHIHYKFIKVSKV